ncbi:MAG: DUF4435 domain-containing protein [Candidatus Helarchaeota archaeon]|nr:DUF4435 domain-containing protein [Candidatus Helarchaeota archaeon]
MGSQGIINFNKRIIFIEGREASTDKQVYEKLYPPDKHNVNFVPAGNSTVVRKISDQINHLLTASVGFQQYFSIVDGDIERFDTDTIKGHRLFELPVYHIENLLINETLIYNAIRSFLGAECPYSSPNEVEEILKGLILSDTHLKPYTRALLDAEVAKLAIYAYNLVSLLKEIYNAFHCSNSLQFIELFNHEMKTKILKDRESKLLNCLKKTEEFQNLEEKLKTEITHELLESIFSLNEGIKLFF